MTGERSKTPSAMGSRACLLLAFLIIIISILNDFHYRFGEGQDTGSSIVGLRLRVDRLIESIAPNGNIFMDFGKPERNAPITPRWYFRGVYDAYPAHVWVADPSVVINDFSQIADNNFSPSDDWLAQHKIATVVRFSSDLTQLNVRAVSAPTNRR